MPVPLPLLPLHGYYSAARLPDSRRRRLPNVLDERSSPVQLNPTGKVQARVMQESVMEGRSVKGRPLAGRLLAPNSYLGNRKGRGSRGNRDSRFDRWVRLAEPLGIVIGGDFRVRGDRDEQWGGSSVGVWVVKRGKCQSRKEINRIQI